MLEAALAHATWMSRPRDTVPDLHPSSPAYGCCFQETAYSIQEHEVWAENQAICPSAHRCMPCLSSEGYEGGLAGPEHPIHVLLQGGPLVSCMLPGQAPELAGNASGPIAIGAANRDRAAAQQLASEPSHLHHQELQSSHPQR